MSTNVEPNNNQKMVHIQINEFHSKVKENKKVRTLIHLEIIILTEIFKKRGSTYSLMSDPASHFLYGCIHVGVSIGRESRKGMEKERL